MKKQITIETQVSELADHEWLSCYQPKDETRETEIDFLLASKEDIHEAAKIWNIDPGFLEALDSTFTYLGNRISELVGADMLDLWKRLDALEKKLDDRQS